MSSNVSIYSRNEARHDAENDKKSLRSAFCYAKPKTRSYKETSNFLTKAELYQNYRRHCTDNSNEPVSYFTFATAFDEQSLSLFSPRKDQCDICLSYRLHQISKEEFVAHIASEKRAKEEKNVEKLAAEISGRHVFTMDTEAVKLCLNITRLQFITNNVYKIMISACAIF